MPLTFGSHTRLLVVAPHPDDETISAGELIQHVQQAGGEVEILLLTDGDNNPWPQRWVERRLWVGPAERERWGRRRRLEVGQALKTLGVRPEALHPLGLPDMGLTAWLRFHLDALLEHVAGRLSTFQPTHVAMPSLGDRHPDHGAAHVLMRLALAHWTDSIPAVLTYLVHGRDPREGEVVVLTPGLRMHGVKLAAMEAYASQMALSGERMRALADRPEQFRKIRALRREARVLPWQLATIRQPWLTLTVVDAGGARSFRGSAAPVTASPGGGVVLDLAPPPPGSPRFAKLHMDLRSPWIFDRWGWSEI
ncbi:MULTISPECIES: PIG-L deacetylase family protein [Dyella]|nr:MULTISPECIES: PIG-L family deacetylase [Dyella]